MRDDNGKPEDTFTKINYMISSARDENGQPEENRGDIAKLQHKKRNQGKKL